MFYSLHTNASACLMLGVVLAPTINTKVFNLKLMKCYCHITYLFEEIAWSTACVKCNRLMITTVTMCQRCALFADKIMNDDIFYTVFIILLDHF